MTTDGLSEFGFLPPELFFKCHEFVRAYHRLHGSGWWFVKSQVLLSRHSPYLRQLERTSINQFRIFQFAIIICVTSVCAAFLFNYWIFLIAAGAAALTYWMDHMGKSTLVQIRALILSNEMLAVDFAGWGDLFPKAMSSAREWLANREPGNETLFDVYMPNDKREKFVEDFKPSSRSVDAAYRDALETLSES